MSRPVYLNDPLVEDVLAVLSQHPQGKVRAAVYSVKSIVDAWCLGNSPDLFDITVGRAEVPEEYIRTP